MRLINVPNGPANYVLRGKEFTRKQIQAWEYHVHDACPGSRLWVVLDYEEEPPCLEDLPSTTFLYAWEDTEWSEIEELILDLTDFNPLLGKVRIDMLRSHDSGQETSQ